MCREAIAQRSNCTEKTLHREAIARRSNCTEKTLHREEILHRESIAQRSNFTEKTDKCCNNPTQKMDHVNNTAKKRVIASSSK